MLIEPSTIAVIAPVADVVAVGPPAAAAAVAEEAEAGAGAAAEAGRESTSRCP